MTSGAAASSAFRTSSIRRMSPRTHSIDACSSADSSVASDGSSSVAPVTVCPSSRSARDSHWPTNPPAPVTSARISVPQPMTRHVGVDHHADQLVERALRLPAELTVRLAGVGDKDVDLGRPHEPRVLLDVVAIVQPHVGERDLAQLSHRPGLSRPDDIVVRLILLKHAPHRVDVVPGKPPIPPRIEGAQSQLFCHPEFDTGDAVGDLARHELESSAWALVVKK